jgi:hypothetical protein
MIKVDWIAASASLKVGDAVLVIFLSLTDSLQNPPANEKQGPLPEEISQILLTSKKKGNTPLTLLTKSSFTFTGRNMFISLENRRSLYKILKPAKPYPSRDPVPLSAHRAQTIVLLLAILSRTFYSEFVILLSSQIKVNKRCYLVE